MKILAIGDEFVPKEMFEEALAAHVPQHEVRFISLDETAEFDPATPSEKKLKEYMGSPAQLIREIRDADVLLIHGAPVSEEVLKVSPNLKIVGVARGGPVNVDVDFARRNGITVLFAPGRNADSVADMTIGYLIMLSRGVLKSIDFIRNGGVLGVSAFEGRQFFGHELGRKKLGLIGFGQVGIRVANRARAFGMKVLAHDPYVVRETMKQHGVEAVEDLHALLSEADFVSLHLRATDQNENFFDRNKFLRMKRGAFFINSARETLVNEEDLLDALIKGHLDGAALDVVRPRSDRSSNPLVHMDNVIVTPHIAGATFEAASRGVEILSEQLHQYELGNDMPYSIKPEPSDKSL